MKTLIAAIYAGTVPRYVLSVTRCEIGHYIENEALRPASARLQLQSHGCAG